MIKVLNPSKDWPRKLREQPVSISEGPSAFMALCIYPIFAQVIAPIAVFTVTIKYNA